MKDKLLFFVLYCLLAILLTHPLMLYFGSAVPTGHYLWFDTFLNIWVLAWDTHAIFTDPLNLFDANVFFPNQRTLAYTENMLFNMLLSLPVRLFSSNPVLQYNFVFLLSFILSGYGSFLLAQEMTGKRLSSFFAGIAFAFCALRFRYIQLLQIISVHWIPFLMLFLIRFLERKRLRDGALFALFFAMLGLTSIYMTILFAVFLSGFFLFYLIEWPGEIINKETLKRLLLPLCLSMIPLVLFHIPYIRLYMGGTFTTYPERGAEVSSNSAGLVSYLLFQKHSMLWSHILPSGAVLEGLSPGIILYGLAVMSAIYFVLKPKGGAAALDSMENKKIRKYVLPIAAGGILCLLISLGPSGVLYNIYGSIFPFFKGLRVPERASCMFLFALSLWSVYGINMLCEILPSRGSQIILNLIIILFFLLENAAIPLGLTRVPDLNTPPQVYLYLRERGGEAPTLELPMPESGAKLYLEVQYTLNSIYHWKRIVNGYSGYRPETYNEVRELIFSSFPREECISRLRAMGVQFIIIHRDMLAEELWEEIESHIDRDLLKLEKDFGRELVFRITDGSDE